MSHECYSGINKELSEVDIEVQEVMLDYEIMRLKTQLQCAEYFAKAFEELGQVLLQYATETETWIED